MICYSTKLIAESQEDFVALRELLEWQRLAFNEASKVQFGQKKNSIVWLHGNFYRKFRDLNPHIPSQVIIRAEQECLARHVGAKSNKHKQTRAHKKTKLSIQLDKRIYSIKKDGSVSITTSRKRKKFKYILYPALEKLLKTIKHGDPLIFEHKNELYISFPFDVKIEPEKQNLALGVDLGIRVAAACSDGRLIKDKKFNGEQRKLRFLKRQLKAVKDLRKSRSAKKHLKKLRRKERNKNKNQTFLIANTILQTKAQVIALENLKGIKAKKHKFQNKNRISQVPLYELRRVLTYKALLLGKQVVVVNPYLTSQIDSVTGQREGERKGRRFYSKSGLIYDADINAARNIGQRSKLPVSYGNILDGQGVITRPIVQNNSNERMNLLLSKLV
jgi:putative transposase